MIFQHSTYRSLPPLPLLFIHGYPLDRTMWASQLASLPDNVHPFAIDLLRFENEGEFPFETPEHSLVNRLPLSQTNVLTFSIRKTSGNLSLFVACLWEAT